VLTAIEIENFKAFGERQRIELRPITLLFGPNSGGKSSVTHALHYLREVVVDGNVDAHRTWSGGESLDLGGMRAFVHGRAPGPTIRLRVEFRLSGLELPTFPNRYRDGLAGDVLDDSFTRSRLKWAAVCYEIDTQGKPHLQAIRVELNGVAFASLVFPREAPHATVENLNWNHPLIPRGEDLSHWEEDEPLESAEDVARELDRDPEESDPDLRGESDEAEDEAEDEYREPDFDDDIDDIDSNPSFAEWDPDLEYLDEEEDEVDDFERREAVDRSSLLQTLYRVAGGQQATARSLTFAKQSGVPAGWRQPIRLVWPIEKRLAEQLQACEDFECLISTLLLGPMSVLAKRLNDFRHIGPLRVLPPRHVEYPDRAGSSRWSSGLQAWHALAHCPDEFMEEVSRWLELEERLDTGYRIERSTFKHLPTGIAAIIADPEHIDRVGSFAATIAALPDHTQVVLRDVNRNLQLQPQDVGVGLSQIVPVIVALLDPGGPLVALEQPELHLHPRQQAALGDAIIKGMTAAPNRVLLIETHSEHLILRLLRRIRETSCGEGTRETALRPEQISVLYVQPVGTNAVVTAIPVSAEGDFTRAWPNGFFAERVKELL
jgi:hypothetical protein